MIHAKATSFVFLGIFMLASSVAVAQNAGMKNLTGKTFGKLRVIAEAGRNSRKRVLWDCVCSCGNKKTASSALLINGHVQSCGCKVLEVMKELHKTHGLRYSAEYMVWSGMISRCENSNCERFHNYGGRGIRICERWKRFENFFADMGPRPSNEHSIDRRNNGGNYTPRNCRWATRLEQSTNRRNNRLLTFREETHCASEWSRQLGIPYRTIMSRIRYGLPVEKILSGSRVVQRNHRFLEFNGERNTIAEWSRRLKIKSGTIAARLHRGWNTERALTT